MKPLCNNLLPKGIEPRTGRFDVRGIRDDFPILRSRIHGNYLVYLDNAATTQKPQSVIDTIARYYQSENANIHRGVYTLSQRATLLYEAARSKVQSFINARESREIIFTRGATEAINLVAHSYGGRLQPGDEILVTAMEHHSNIVPWQLLCQRTGAVLRVIPMNERGELLCEEYQKLLGPRTRIVAAVQLSNALGTINPVKRMAELAHEAGAVMLVDGAQWVAHGPTDVQDLDCDFYVFSGHKMFGPTGIGVLYGRSKLLESMPPWQGGGDMIESVSFDKTTFAPPPAKFEAGTPHIAGAIALGEAIDYIRSIGFAAFAGHERELLTYATQRLSAIDGVRLIGTAAHKASVISFVVENPPVSSLDLGTKLDAEGIAVRTGHHCCQPTMACFGIPGTTRVSLAMYNTREEIDQLADAVQRIVCEAAQKSRPAAPAALAWPAASADSPQAAADELAEVFELLGEREVKNEHLLDLGEKLPRTFDLLQRISERVPGCMSQVYMVGRLKPGTEDVLELLADADADIVRGLIAVLLKIYSGQRLGDILAFDIEGFFRRIGLEGFISSQRRTGLEGMIRRIRAIAQKHLPRPQAVGGRS